MDLECLNCLAAICLVGFLGGALVSWATRYDGGDITGVSALVSIICAAVLVIVLFFGTFQVIPQTAKENAIECISSRYNVDSSRVTLSNVMCDAPTRGGGCTMYIGTFEIEDNSNSGAIYFYTEECIFGSDINR